MVGCWSRLEDLDVCPTVLVGVQPQTYSFLTASSSLTTQAYALAYFLPIILNQNMEFSIGESQMLTAPPYAGAAIVMFICAWIGDKYRVRGPLLLFTAVLGLTGLPLLVSPATFH